MANKKQINVKLVGVLSNGDVAKTHQADRVIAFVNDKRSIRIPVPADSCYLVNMITADGSYKLYAHKTIENVWMGFVKNKIKVHFKKKKVVGKIIYWA